MSAATWHSSNGGVETHRMANHGILGKLHQHHRSITRLIRDIDERIDLGDNDYGELYTELRRELLSHSVAEDETFFGALASFKECREDVRDGREEHEEIEEILHELDRTEDEDEWLATFQELEETVLHHIDEVEHDTFPLAERHLDKEVLERLGHDYQRERGRARTAGTGVEADEDDDEDTDDDDETDDDDLSRRSD